MLKSMDTMVALCKNRGFIYPGSEIYGGLANTWDYGPLGVELKENVKKAWRRKFIQENPYNVGLDAAILMNPKVWEATGHVTTFNDPLIDCKSCKSRFRADNLIEEQFKDVDVNGMSQKEMNDFIKEHNVICPVCGNIITSVGSGSFSCCGITLPKQEPEEDDGDHLICIETVDNEYHVWMEHPMNKNHYVSFIAYVTSDSVEVVKLYPEQSISVRFRRKGHGMICAYCNRHGMFRKMV